MADTNTSRKRKAEAKGEAEVKAARKLRVSQRMNAALLSSLEKAKNIKKLEAM